MSTLQNSNNPFKKYARPIAISADWAVFGSRIILGLTSFYLVYTHSTEYFSTEHQFPVTLVDLFSVAISFLAAVVVDGGLVITLPYVMMVLTGTKVSLKSKNPRMVKFFNIVVGIFVILQLSTTGSLSLIFAPKAAKDITKETDTRQYQAQAQNYNASYQDDKDDFNQSLERANQGLLLAISNKENSLSEYEKRAAKRLHEAQMKKGSEMYKLYHLPTLSDGSPRNPWSHKELATYIRKANAENEKDKRNTLSIADAEIATAKQAIEEADDKLTTYIEQHSEKKDSINLMTTGIIGQIKRNDQASVSTNSTTLSILIIACLFALVIATLIKVIYETVTEEEINDELTAANVLGRGFNRIRRGCLKLLDSIFSFGINIDELLKLFPTVSLAGICGVLVAQESNSQQSENQQSKKPTVEEPTDENQQSGKPTVEEPTDKNQQSRKPTVPTCKDGTCIPNSRRSVAVDDKYIEHYRTQWKRQFTSKTELGRERNRAAAQEKETVLRGLGAEISKDLENVIVHVRIPKV